MGKMQRDKGKRGERATANEITEALGIDCHRGWQARDGADAPDVVGLPGWWVEVKAGKALGPRAALLQAEKAAGGKTKSLAVLRYDREKPMVILRWSDFIDMLIALKVPSG